MKSSRIIRAGVFVFLSASFFSPNVAATANDNAAPTSAPSTGLNRSSTSGSALTGLSNSKSGRENSNDGSPKSSATNSTDNKDKHCACMAADPNNGQKKHKGGPIRHVLKGLTKELGSDLSDMGKDSMLVFSAQDFDPYASKPGRNPKRPYVVGDAEYIDGSQSQIVKFPDRSLRIYGGFCDGTYACPKSPDASLFDVFYPNGAKGELVVSSNGTAIIKRPDKTITKITKVDGGGYKITNDKLGFIGEINTDETGLNYELARSSNPVKNLQ